MNTVGWEKGCVKLIDQTLLPHEYKIVRCRNVRALWQAIKTLKVRGAPAIGVAAAYGVVLACGDKSKNLALTKKRLRQAIRYLGQARPTAVNLKWALGRMEEVIRTHQYDNTRALAKKLKDEADLIKAQDKRSSLAMAKYALPVIKAGDVILTHCNTGPLATAGGGTAVGAVIYAHRRKKIKVIASETRPLLQGARLNIWEMRRAGVPVTLICDNMAAALMKEGSITKVMVGADRIAANGDTANKIGTYMHALCARHHKIPFYIVAPFSTVDPHISTGRQIPIEERHADEVRKIRGKLITDARAKVRNPAFDVTPAHLISGIITDRGLLKPPFRASIRKALGK